MRWIETDFGQTGHCFDPIYYINSNNGVELLEIYNLLLFSCFNIHISIGHVVNIL